MVESILGVVKRGYTIRKADTVERVQSLNLVTIKGQDIGESLTTHEAARKGSSMLYLFDCRPSENAVKACRMSTACEEDWVYSFE